MLNGGVWSPTADALCSVTMTSRTLTLTIDPVQPDDAAIAAGAEALAAGRLVAFPTETVYGLGANALDALAVDRIFAAKQRPFNDPLIVHLADADRLDQVAIDVPALAWRLADHFWPGPLTLVLRRARRVAENVSAGRSSVAVRVPAHPIAQALLRHSGLPIAAPSANLFSRPSPTTARHVLDDLDGRIDLVLDGGPTAIGLESTVLDLTQDPPCLLRPGGVPIESLREVLPDLRAPAAPNVVGEDAPAASPGVLLKHYAPHAPMVLLRGKLSSAAPMMHRAVILLQRQGLRPGLLVPDEEVPLYADLRVDVVALGPSAEMSVMGRALFARLRELDRFGVDLIVARDVSHVGLGLAVSDRLFRAAEGHVLDAAEAPSLEEFFSGVVGLDRARPQTCV